MWRIPRLFLLLLPFSLSVLQAQEPSAFTVDDDINYVQISSPVISPDGQKVVFVRSDLNWKENERETRLYLVPADGGEAFRFTAGPEDRDPKWSPDGAHVAFIRATPSKDDKENGEKSQIWVIPAAGGEAFQLTDVSEGVNQFVWSPTSDGVVFSADDPKSKEEKKRVKDGFDAIYVFEGPNGQGRASWSNIWKVNLSDKKCQQVTHEQMRVSGLDVSPDGERVALVYRRENARNRQNLAEIGMARLDDGKLIRLTENKAPESRVRWKPNSRELGYLAPSDTTWELRQDRLYVMDVEIKEHRLVSGPFKGDISNFVWSSDGSRALIEAGAKTNRLIFDLDASDGSSREILANPGVARTVSFSSDGNKAAFVWSDALHAPDVYSIDLSPGAKPKQLTDLNPEFRDKVMAHFEVVTWKSKDGLPIEGLLFLPPDRKPDERVPLILQVHGGPAGVFTNSWNTSYHILAGLGYAVLCPNVRGSTAYGDDLLRGNMKDIGGGDYQDLMTGVDKLIKDELVDSERMGIRGWSYGGILGGWTITQTNRFKAASLGAMVSDWTSEYGQGFNHDVSLWYIGGSPWTNPDAYRRMSPMTHVANISTPTLILHGERDTTDTIEQSMNFHNALWERGVPTRFIRFPREPHGLREPRHQRTRLVEEIAWMQKYIRGIEWSDERKEEKEEEKPTS